MNGREKGKSYPGQVQRAEGKFINRVTGKGALKTTQRTHGKKNSEKKGSHGSETVPQMYERGEGGGWVFF